jgi:hypothetical protein
MKSIIILLIALVVTGCCGVCKTDSNHPRFPDVPPDDLFKPCKENHLLLLPQNIAYKSVTKEDYKAEDYNITGDRR